MWNMTEEELEEKASQYHKEEEIRRAERDWLNLDFEGKVFFVRSLLMP